MADLNINEIAKIISYTNGVCKKNYILLYPYFETMLLTGCRPAEIREPNRFIYINDSLIEFLPDKRNNMRYFEKKDFNKTYFNWIIQQATKDLTVSPRYVARWFNIYSGETLRTGNKRLSTYLYRHYYVKYLYNKKIPVSEIQLIMGHKDIQSTYAYVNSIISDPY